MLVRPRNRPRALRRSTDVIGSTGRRSATSAQPGYQSREAGLEESTTAVGRTAGQKFSDVFEGVL